MDNAGQITEEEKNEIYKKIVDIMLASLDNGSITAEDSEQASMFILERLDSAPDRYHMDAIIEEFVKRWPIFSPLLAPKLAKQAEDFDAQKIEELKSEINSITN